MSEILFMFPETGVLTIEKVFFESYLPILFTARSNLGSLYLCVLCNSDSQHRKWLLSETSPENIVSLLEDKISLRNAFLIDKRRRYTVTLDCNLGYKLVAEPLEDWHPTESCWLPTPDKFLEAEDNEYTDEIIYYKEMILT